MEVPLSLSLHASLSSCSLTHSSPLSFFLPVPASFLTFPKASRRLSLSSFKLSVSAAEKKKLLIFSTNGGDQAISTDNGGDFRSSFDGNECVLDFVSSDAASTSQFYSRAITGHDAVLRQYVYPKSANSAGGRPMESTVLSFISLDICLVIGEGGGACGFNSYCILQSDQNPRWAHLNAKELENGVESGEEKKSGDGCQEIAERSILMDFDKSSQKKSHNILLVVGSKVKHSITKVKKVVTGKSSHPKTSSPPR
ncbi:hypothetical protein RHMOL_Rhmol10G0024600 [Rhododendron molle]|uniref:Uncharacterized protein n=1 Tax=Rhododendron molle TaxID=49168 RepID=A0ACC0LY52_RHOML|nr:hypothetical protein RHMOL_Rhmol10G0024600 [Rhododendron molle]